MLRRRIIWVGLFIAGLGVLGCNADSTRIRVDRARLVGLYEAKFGNDNRERLELKANGTYIQDFISRTRPFQHTGTWRIENHFWGGSDIILVNAVVTEGEETRPLGTGDCRLNAHDHSGKVALARNEVMDWYYEPVQ